MVLLCSLWSTFSNHPRDRTAGLSSSRTLPCVAGILSWNHGGTENHGGDANGISVLSVSLWFTFSNHPRDRTCGSSPPRPFDSANKTSGISLLKTPTCRTSCTRESSGRRVPSPNRWSLRRHSRRDRNSPATSFHSSAERCEAVSKDRRG